MLFPRSEEPMRRADRLFEIIQILRRRKLARASDLAEHFEVSERTIYRDIQDLIVSGVPIEGEAGVGYVLRGGFDLPPLMFNERELEALVLGARMVQSWSDPELAEAAADVIAKVETVIPAALREHMAKTALIAPARHYAEPVKVDMQALRAAVRERHKLRLSYCDEQDRASEREVRPLALAFYGPVWLLVAWCELRVDFRCFRLDRIAEASVLAERFRLEPGRTLQDFLKRDGE